MADEDQNADLERKLRFSQRLNIVFGAAAAFLLIVVVAQLAPSQLLTGSQATASPSATTTRTPTVADQVARNKADDPMAIGALDAPVTMVVWTDLRCPYCSLFENETMPQIVEEYVDTGQVRLEVHDMAIFGDQSVAAAVAARAAGQQGKYFEYISALFAAAPQQGHPDLPREKLVGFATTAGVPDMAAFNRALGDTTLTQAVQSSTASAKQLGVTSVPFFAIGDKSVSGAQPMDTFRQTIDAEITAAGR